MSRTSLFTQIAMIAIAVAIGMLYLKPTIASIRVTQDNTDKYNIETENVSAVNLTLKSKLDTINSITLTDSEKLATFMPNQVDDVKVMKDIQNLLTSSGLATFSVDYKGGDTKVTTQIGEEASGLEKHNFSVAFKGNYDQIKKVLSLIEVSDYILQVSHMSIKPENPSYFSVDLTLTAFNRIATTGAGTALDLSENNQ